MEQSKIERLLQLIMLMAGRTDYTIEEISERLGMTSRSIYRYIETIRKAGFAVEKRRPNLYKLIRIPNSSVNLGNLVYFSYEEAFLIHSLIQGLQCTNSLKTSLLKKLTAIYNVANIPELIFDKDTSKNIEGLGNAIRNKRQVILRDYQSAHSHSISDRHIEPFAFTTNYIEVWGFDVEKQENRIFKIARIGSVEELNESWEHTAYHQQSRTDCFRMNGTNTYNVTIVLSLRAKNLLIEEYPLAAKDIIEENGKWVFKSEVYDLAGVGRFVLGLAGEVSIINSPDLETYVRSYAKEHILPYIKESETNGPALNVFTTE